MKKTLFTLAIFGLLVACTSTQEKEMDATGGASLNRADTIAQYEELKEKIDVIANNPNATPEDFTAAQGEVRAFQDYLMKYEEAASPGAKKYIEQYRFNFDNHSIFEPNRRSGN